MGSGDAGGKTDMPTAFQNSWHSTQYRPRALSRSINDAGVSLAGALLGVTDAGGGGADDTAATIAEAGADGPTLTCDVALHAPNRSATATQTDPRTLRPGIVPGRCCIREPYTAAERIGAGPPVSGGRRTAGDGFTDR